MGRYLFADFVVELQNEFPYLERQCCHFVYNGDRETDFVIHVTEEERAKESHVSQYPESQGYLESVCAYRKLCMQLPKHRAMLLHASVIEAEDGGSLSLLAAVWARPPIPVTGSRPISPR